MTITIKETNILKTILGSGNASFFIKGAPYVGFVNQSDTYRAALRLYERGLVVVICDEERVSFTAYSVQQYRDMLRERDDAALSTTPVALWDKKGAVA